MTGRRGWPRSQGRFTSFDLVSVFIADLRLQDSRPENWDGRIVCVCVFGGLTNKPGLRASEEVYCAGSFLSVTVEEPAKRSANDRPARLTRSDKVRPKARHERAGCSSRRAVSWARNTHPISCIPSFIYKACLRSS